MDPVLAATAAVAALLGVLVAVTLVLAAQAPGRRRVREQLARAQAEVEALRSRVDRLDLATTSGGAEHGRDPGTEYLITSLSEGGDDADVAEHRLTGRAFADVAVGESLLKVAAFAHGVRRAVSPENRNRIRFEMAREVKRSRRQRRRDLKLARQHLRETDRAGADLTEDAA